MELRDLGTVVAPVSSGSNAASSAASGSMGPWAHKSTRNSKKEYSTQESTRLKYPLHGPASYDLPLVSVALSNVLPSHRYDSAPSSLVFLVDLQISSLRSFGWLPSAL